MRRLAPLAFLALLAVAGTTLVAPLASPAQAANGGEFDPANIISDSEFYNSAAMTESDVQAFLASQSCSPRDGVPCLTSYSQATPSKPSAGAGHCAAYEGSASESASRIIVKTAQACGINPRVILVLLQKEQALITSPSSYGYARATGYGCPDTSGCDAVYFGFFNQVYRAVWQFRQYTLKPYQWSYGVGPTRVQFNPNADCGSSVINIANQATANLYNYTPYQPNAAALANLYGTGDSCSSYGNRNFWRLYSDWFGSPTDRSPRGQLENMQAMPGGIGIWGWALDTDSTSPLWVHVYMDGRMVLGALANSVRQDIGTRFGVSPERGFSLTVPAPAGRHEVCVYAINVGQGDNKAFGCNTVDVGGSPVGIVDNIQPRAGGMNVWGWTIDPDSTDPLFVHFYVDGVMVKGLIADIPRSDLGSIKPGYGANHSFAASLDMAPGAHTICAYAINVGPAAPNSSLGCTAVVAGGSPLGAVDPLSVGLGTVTVSGWVLDPDTTKPIATHLYLDGSMVVGLQANLPRTDLGIYDSFGDHGFTTTLTVSPGRHSVCVYGLNVGLGANTQVSCTSFEVGGSPKGALENAQPGFGRIGVWGWGFDPDTATPAAVHVYVDGQMRGGFTADVPRSDLPQIPAAYGTNHGFGVWVPADAGTHEVCSYVLNSGYGQNLALSCAQVTVSGDPVGAIENIQPVGAGLGVWGYAADPATAGPISVSVFVDGQLAATGLAQEPRGDLADRFPGYGNAHAFGVMVPTVSAGKHQVCVTAINQGAGVDTPLGCISVSK